MIKEIDGVKYVGFFDEDGKFQILNALMDDEEWNEYLEDHDET